MNIVGELRYFLDGDYAKLTFTESGTSLSLDTVIVPNSFRRQGIGSELVRRVLIIADATGKEVYLSARPLGGFSEEVLENLVRYYQKFGFEEYDRALTVVYMKRAARPLP